MAKGSKGGGKGNGACGGTPRRDGSGGGTGNRGTRDSRKEALRSQGNPARQSRGRGNEGEDQYGRQELGEIVPMKELKTTA